MPDPTVAPEDERDEPAAPLILPGNPPNIARGGVVFVVGALLSVMAMSATPRLAHGFAMGLVGCLLAAGGVVDLFGGFDDRERIVRRITVGVFGVTPALWVLAAGATFVTLSLSVQGRLSPSMSGALVTASFLSLVAATFAVGEALGPLARDEDGAIRPLHRRHGFWLCVVASLVSLPTLGSHSLTDPWETHYGEVAREMLSRDDWISTWWAQEGWFFSKPVLNFWLQALFMAALGVKFQPGQMLAPTGGFTPRPEWAVRMPVFLLALVGSYLLYKGVARAFGRRAGLLGGLALWTMPQWFMLSHQTMADMPFVAAMSAAMGLFLLGIFTPEDQPTKTYALSTPLGEVRFSAFTLLLFTLSLAVLPQVFYLASRNLVWNVAERSVALAGDTFWAGSFGNCSLPGNDPCSLHRPADLRFQPWIQAGAWALVLALIAWASRGERRLSRLAFLGAFVFAGVSTLGKGPAGLLLPVACAGVYVLVTGRFRDLTRMELVVGLAVVVCVAAPWYLAMHVRHGPQFIDRLIVHDMWKRALTHVHDTNEGDDTSFRFYVWQLGYALFPWTGLVPAAIVSFARRPDDDREARGDASIFLATWFVFAFALFSGMLTKFHHYIFPAVPPAAMLVGVLCDRWLSARTKPLAFGLSALGGVLIAYGVYRLLPGQLDGFRGELGWLRPPNPGLAAAAITVGAAVVAWVAYHTWRDPDGAETDHRASAIFALCGALLVALVGRDLVVRPENDTIGEARLLHLFTYNYRRLFPENLDFRGLLAGVTAGAALATGLAMIPRLRATAIAMLGGVSLAFAAWGLWSYFPKTSPHWGQRETIAAYYQRRASHREPLIAFQMNWKGENFYTGNHVPAFVSSGEKFKQYMKEQRGRGARVFFFTTEHSRIGSLRAELGNPEKLEILTDKKLDNKFALVRVAFGD